MDDAEVACCCFVVPGCEASGAFELVEAALDLVSKGIDKPIDCNNLLSVGPGRNDRCSTTPFYSGADVIGVITLIGNEDFCSGQVAINKNIIAFIVGHFPAGDFCSDRKSHGVGDQMNLGRKATF